MSEIHAHLNISEDAYNNIVIDQGRKYLEDHPYRERLGFWLKWWTIWRESDIVEMLHCQSHPPLELYIKSQVHSFDIISQME